MSKLLTIVIPSYNVSKFLPDVIPNYLDKRIMDDIEILIVDDGSKDNTAEIGLEYQEKYPQTIRLLHKENGGHGSTINHGIKYATGKYFKVIDGDDWVDTDAFVRFIEKLRAVDSDMVISPFKWINEQTMTEEKTTEYPELKENECYTTKVLTILSDNKYAMHALTFKTEIMRTIPQISEHCFYVDMEYVSYPLRSIKKIAFIDEAIYQYRVGNAGQSMAISNFQKNRKMHQHVIMQLINYYKENDFDVNVKDMLQRKIAHLCQIHINTYCTMPITTENMDELKEFISFIKQQIPDIIRKIPGKKEKILVIINGRLNHLVVRLYQFTH